MEKDTENRILLAAEREFMTKGFAGSRTTSIAEQAGVTHAMLHYYFRTKDKLFERIVAEKMALIGSIVSQSVDMDNIPIEEIIRTVIERHLDFLAANPDLPRFLIGELYGPSGRGEILKEKIRHLAPSIIKKLQDKIDSESRLGRCKRLNASQLLLEIISLNVFPFMAAPLVDSILGGVNVGSKDFIERKKKSNFEIIMNQLKP